MPPDRPPSARPSADEKRQLVRALLAQRDGGPVPLGPGQQSLWFLSRLAPGSPAYNFVFAGATAEAVRAGPFRAAVAELVARHPALRARVCVRDGVPCQVADAPGGVVEFVPFAGRADAAFRAAVDALADRPFDLEAGPAYRVAVFDRGVDRVVVFVAHHLIADLWSMDLLVEELAALYSRHLGRALPPLPAPGPTPAELLRDQLGEAFGPHGQKSLDYWLGRLGGDTPVLQLPTDRPRPPVQTYAGGSHSWALPARHCEALARKARALGATPFMAYLGLFELLLHRLTGQDDFAVGVAVADRARPGRERAVGYLLNQLPLRADFARPCPTFADLVGRARDQVLEALDHQSYPFGMLVRKLQPPRDPSRPPVFQVMFVWDKPRPPAPAPDLRMVPVVMEQRGSAFELTFVVFEVGQQLTACFRYNSDLFDADTIRRFADAFDNLFVAAAAPDPVPVCGVELVSPPERERLLRGFNRPPAPNPAREAFPARVRLRAVRTPAAAAVRFEGDALTYSQLAGRVELLAGAMAGAGVVAGDLVAIVLPRGVGVVVAILAAWHCGAAYSYLEPAEPPARLRDLLGELRPRVAVASSDLPAPGLTRLDPSSVGPRTPAAALDPRSPAYVIFTSGSTGRPKGVVLSHANLENLTRAVADGLPVRTEDRVAQLASFAFDASVFDYVSALDAGAELVIAPRDSLLTGESAAEFLRRSRVTLACLPPSLLARVPPQPLPDLRRLVVAGEACPADLAAFWAVGREMYNAYGPTECTVWATLERLVPGESPTIGRPIRNALAYVVDADLNLQPVGVPGELCLGGLGVGSGYLGRPALSAERFLPDPFAGDPEAMIYRTGDRARWTADGRLELAGRTDHQLKVRGYRIEPDEVAAVLRSHPQVRDAAVVARLHHGEVGLAAFVVPEAGPFVLSEVRESLRARLPHHLIPATLRALAALPLTRNGKVDRAALQALPQEARPPAEARPSPPTEAALLEAVRKVLKLDAVAAGDNFFELGGASIQVLELVTRAESVGLSLSPDMVFRSATLADLAAAARPVAGGAAAPPDPAPASPPPPAPRAPELPRPTIRIESLGAYLPAKSVSTREVVEGCRATLTFPLERLTGIASRRVASDAEFSIDLAEKAARDCLSRSSYHPADIDLLICCNISRCDGAAHRFSLEPTTAAKLRARLGLTSAFAFDLSNACAGTFTGLRVAESLLRSGAARRALVVSGEYITHLTRTAQLEIEHALDPQIASLTLGDAGVALLLDRSPDPAVGFQALDLFTLGKHHRLCVAQVTDRPHGGARMATDLVRGPAVAIRQAVAHAAESLRGCGWDPAALGAVVMHQTSATTLAGAVREINDFYGRPVCTPANVVNNLSGRGNTATTSHFLAVWELMRVGRFAAGSRALFAVTGSGQTIGTALYAFDDLAGRVLGGAAAARPPAAARGAYRHDRIGTRLGVRAWGVAARPGASVEMVVDAGAACLARAGVDPGTIDLVIHTGVYRTDFLSEPALAAIAAGELRINHDDEAPTGRRTFAFDLANGAAGTLTACYLGARMAAAGEYRRLLVLASEADQNEAADPENLVGVRRTASALVLDSEAGHGFAAFGVKHFPGHVEAYESYTKLSRGATAVCHRAVGYEEALAACVEETVADFLTAEGLTAADLDRVVLPFRLLRFRATVLRDLGFASHSLAFPRDGGRDPFTSGIADALEAGLRVGRGERVLFVEAGSGVVVVCALYEGGGP